MSLYKVGKIVNTHGIRGEVRVVPTTDFPMERFKKNNKLVIVTKPNNIEVQIATVREHKQFILVSFVNMQNINDVEQYKGCELMVTEDLQQDLSSDEFYYHDIIGLKIIDNASQEVIGTVSEILPMPANDVWVVTAKGSDDILLPFIEDVVTMIDLEQGIAKVNLLEEI
ncbi:ribosome maturation factor RimM [Weissella sagaensis]|uniref:Ribosome maturation factor RimM n=1 Tax=Weissella sagaensis TaxID=2559928 RepID=A0ABW1RT44_9LACO|nr:ribosome maturation factor RimM [Weissella sagaensis]MBU7568340.1 ribosome maturation factor RimM [Weissella hellenica]QDJ59126.1 ribosome maturation factor RimM [Weissella hellenica]QEA56418.1 ribosome maturation factor RimM [Weissella hellenica]UEG67240.1 ribosome maturation factor RimM [Weissella hellenica]